MSESSHPTDPIPEPPPEPDELRRLVPRLTRPGLIALVAACLAALVAAWFAPPWANPRLEPAGGSITAGMWNTPFILATMPLSDSQRGVTILGVDDIPGARVVAAWVTRAGSTPDFEHDPWTVVNAMTCDATSCRPTPGAWRPTDTASLIDALIAAGSPLRNAALPQRAGPGDVLWVIWQVTDCQAAPEEGSGPLGAAVTVRLRSPLGFPVRQTDVRLSTPFDFGREQLVEWGACPA